jgi:hypothetical protein
MNERRATVTLAGKGWRGAAILGLLVLSGAVGMPVSTVNDPALRASIERELRAEQTRRLLPDLTARVAERDAEGTEELVEVLEHDRPQVIAMRATRPVVRIGRDAQWVVWVRYSSPMGGSSGERYYRYEQSLLGSWHYRGETSAMGYYLNLL